MDKDDEDDCMEEAEVVARKAPREPTEAERLRHEATHIPYRAWCTHCVRGRGRRKPHFRQHHTGDDNRVPKISMDYFFLGGEECEANGESDDCFA